MRNDLNRWCGLACCMNNKKPYHWKSVYNEYNKWSRDNIFQEAFQKFVSSTYYKHTMARQRKHLDLFIDVTKINNLRGIDNVAMNSEYTKRNVTPLTVLCDQNKLPLSVSPIKINKIYTTGRKTSVHDVKGIQGALDELVIDVPDYVSCRLIGDKGYVTSEAFYMHGKHVQLIAPKRRNQRKRTSGFEKKKLRSRGKIENLFATMKQSSRVFVRREALLRNYLSFVFMSFLSIHIRHVHTQ